jgi:threonine dehydrogenase-like Zn-dependent dehydrogenase
MGEVVEVGNSVMRLKRGDRVVVPFTIACGNCYFCRKELWSLCDNSNPNAWMAEQMYGSSASGLFGYSHLFGGYAGGQAEYVRVPFADVGPIKVPSGLSDEQVLFLSDIFPTGYMAAENCNIQPGDVVAIWGCGPVGQFAIKSALMLGAERVIAIDRIPERLAMAEHSGAQVLNYDEADTLSMLKEWTGGRGPDSCIDAVGWRPTTTASARSTTRSSRPLTSRPTGRRRCARRSRPAARVARSRSPACTAGLWIRSRWGPCSIRA